MNYNYEFDEDDINEANAREQYENIKGTILHTQNNEVPASPSLIAWAVADSLYYHDLLQVMEKMAEIIKLKTQKQIVESEKVFNRV